MRNKICTFALIAFVFLTVQHNVAHTKRILIIASIAQYSHQITYRRLALELNKRGHEIVSVTANPINSSSLMGYKEIDLSYLYTNFVEYKSIFGTTDNFYRMSLERPYLEVERTIWSLVHVMNSYVFKNSEMQKLYAADSTEYFDAVIVAQGPTVSMNAFAHRFHAPLIGISSLDVFNLMRYTLGSLILPSHISNWQIDTPVENDVSFWGRLVNFWLTWKQIYYWTNFYAPMEDALARKHLGPDIPYIDDITKNMSVYLVNRHPLLSHSRPEQANIVLFYSFHLEKKLSPLPEDLKRFLDGAKNGFIYISFGSRIDWKCMPNNLLTRFIESLCSLPYRVVWKINANLLPGNCKNTIASEWLLQKSILAHPNIKLFIYQGGLQSTEEAIYYTVPLVGYPIMWDQVFQVRNIVRLGIGVHLRHDTLSNESIRTAIYEVIGNKRYKNQIMELSRRYKDVPYDSIENAVKWVEYVMRQNGTPFLRDSLCDKPWYQRYDWDIIGFLAIMAFVISLISMYALFWLLCFLCNYYKILCNKSEYCKIKSKIQ